MNSPIHAFSELFAQLGLAFDEAGIRQFLDTHSPLAAGVRLPEADFWTPAQAAFLCESVGQDSDWAELVDQLSASLRGPEKTNK